MNEPRRCKWAADDLLIRYHDNEYGKIITDDNKLFEKLSLEIFQAGLSWRTVLTKRDALKDAFLDFKIKAVAELSDAYLDTLLANSAIIRNKKKIYAVRENARAVQKIVTEGQTFFKFIYAFHDPDKLMHSLKGYGFTFIGKTIIESFMQSIGILEAHEANCFLHRQSSGEV
jgi:DNA-3-methyladenine glycosylase I